VAIGFGRSSLEEPNAPLLNGHNLGNDKHRKLWNALSATELEKEPFWPPAEKIHTGGNEQGGD